MKNKGLFNIPATMSEYPQPITFKLKEMNKFVSLVKLKVFYEGITPDNRQFTRDFSEKVLRSLPQTPVVAYHDGEDFIGHNYEQYVYGYVPEIGEINFETIDGQVWAVTDIILFTGRDDNIGEVASQIFNKKHSLELSKNTSYEVHKDSSGNNRVVFTDTDGVVGLSVLGDNQEPGFTGSEFFEDNKSTLEKLVKEYAMIKEKELLPINFTESFKSGGAKMNLKEAIAHLNDFMKSTFDEIYQDVQMALLEQNEWFYIMDISEDKVVYIDFEEGLYYRASYEITEEEGVKFGAAEIVRVRFLTDDEIEEIFTSKEVDFENLDEPVEGDGEEKEEVEEEEEDNVEEPLEEPEEESIEEEPEAKLEEEPKEPEVEDQVVDLDDLTEPQFSEEELRKLEEDLAELELYRLEKKKEILESFVEFLTKEQIDEFKNSLSDYNVEELEQKLSVIAMKKVREAKGTDNFNSVIGIKPVSKNEENRNSKSNTVARLIAQNK